jgi:hypothetical protein
VNPPQPSRPRHREETQPNRLLPSSQLHRSEDPLAEFSSVGAGQLAVDLLHLMKTKRRRVSLGRHHFPCGGCRTALRSTLLPPVTPLSPSRRTNDPGWATPRVPPEVDPFGGPRLISAAAWNPTVSLRSDNRVAMTIGVERLGDQHLLMQGEV